MSIERTPLDVAALPEGARKVLAPNAPPPLKMMAARGLAPLGPAELPLVLYQLALDANEGVRQAALKSAAELPDKQLEPALAAATEPRVLDFFAEHVARRPKLAEALLLNKHLDDETVRTVAAKADERLCELIAQNEQRLMRCPGVIAALYLNKNARASTVDRAVELAARNGVRVDGVPAFDEVVAALQAGDGAASGEADAAFAEAAAIDAEGGSALHAALASSAPPAAVAMGGGPATATAVTARTGSGDATAPAPDAADEQKLEQVEQEAEQPASKKKQNIATLPLTAKIRLATLGNAFHRAVLVRDSNKLVAMAAVRSPMTTELEIIRLSANRSVIDDVIRYIANKREFLRHYQVKVNLVSNPKTPVGTSLKLLAHLHDKDLRNLAKSKGIPQVLATQAKRIMEQRQPKPAGGAGGHH